jgi:hypothetical protein
VPEEHTDDMIIVVAAVVIITAAIALFYYRRSISAKSAVVSQFYLWFPKLNPSASASQAAASTAKYGLADVKWLPSGTYGPIRSFSELNTWDKRLDFNIADDNQHSLLVYNLKENYFLVLDHNNQTIDYDLQRWIAGIQNVMLISGHYSDKVFPGNSKMNSAYDLYNYMYNVDASVTRKDDNGNTVKKLWYGTFEKGDTTDSDDSNQHIRKTTGKWPI